MEEKSALRKIIKNYIETIKNPEGIYNIFKKLNYPKETIFDSSYIKKIKEFSFAKDEREKIKKIYTVMSYDKLNVFLIEATSLTKPLIRYIANKFAEMYTRCLLIITTDYSEIKFIFPDYEKKEVGKHKLKTTTLILKKDELYYTDIEIMCNLFLEDQNKTWREIWRLWKDAFNVQKVTEKFFEDYKRIFFVVRKDLKKQKVDTKNAHEFTLQFLNRIMFIYFVAKKEWLNNDKKFIKSYWNLYKHVSKFGNNDFYDKWLKPLFFEAFNNKVNYHAELSEEVNRILSNSPYLNGGLFIKKEGLDDLKISISDNLFKEIFDFFESYNFTIKEDSILDLEVSVDPQMIGYVYESLANVSADVYEKEEDLRGDWGIFYTSRVEVDFMCRRSLVEYLEKNLNIPKEELYEFVFDEDKEKIEKKFNQRRCWSKIEEALDNLSIVDPACGSGAFLVGMLSVLVELYKVIYKHLNSSLSDFQLKYRVIQRSLYGVDVMLWAIHASELRLWLQLIVETQFKNEELKQHPLLPNLNMNLRIGDSLVQEIGGISFNVRNNNLKAHIKRKLEELKNEKRRYFENSPSAKYKSLEEFKVQEIKLFEEILEERIESLEKEIKLLFNSENKKLEQTALFGDSVNVEAKSIQKEKKKLVEIEGRIKECSNEVEKLNKVKKLLYYPTHKPFVWDIDFAEVFADKGGFDIVIGNPPYVRQEKIAPPNKLKEEITLQDRRDYKEMLINSVQNRFSVINSWDKKSDLYIYFYFHGLSLLNSRGVLCFITSNSWLDVGYGKGLQEFLLRYSQVIGVYDNQAKRSFEHADVNTIIALLGAPVIKEQKSLFDYGLEYNNKGKATYYGFNQIAKFIMFKKPFEEVVNSTTLIKIDKTEKILKTNEFRVYPINQEDLLEDGWEYPENYDNGRFKMGKYAGNKWGGKYLRAPDLYFKLINTKKFVTLSKLANVSPGCYTGINDFFYVDEILLKKRKIEKEYLSPIIRSSRIVTKLNVDDTQNNFVLAIPTISKNTLKNKGHINLLSYLEWGEKQVTRKRQKTEAGIPWPKVETVKNRKYWYSIPEKNLTPTNLFMQYVANDRFYCPFSKVKITSDRCFHRIFPKEEEDYLHLAASLNSTIQTFLVMLFGRSGLGQGALKFETSDAKRIPILKLNKTTHNIKNVIIKLGSREPMSVYQECGIDSTKPIREQEPKPLSDRAELDNILFDELGLTKEERKEVYWAVCELVQQRLSKAMSLKKK
ncbi:MAG: Eco57I restriction-modification methylase domain-containing protein [Nanoarchaeota archaeon]|nr:Eco57I restriction-modification methylase domain-containing protein [Nanoarchaeota archaeon]